MIANPIADFRSDTVTKPTIGMRQAMLDAAVGDDVFGTDPTVNELQARVAGMFGTEAALFFPSGTMANQVAIMVHAQSGDEIICHETAHIYRYEGGGIASNAGVSVRLLQGERGMYFPSDVLANINPDDPHFPVTKMLEVENTANRGGGACWDMNVLKELAGICKNRDLKFHMDGARLWNAIAATGTAPVEFGKLFDSISVCFSKGLGCPVGSVLVGSRETIAKAHRLRKRMGGGMRQVGFLAAACLYALDHHLDRLKLDHENAANIGMALKDLPWLQELLPVETNIVLFKTPSTEFAESLIQKLESDSILVNSGGAGWIRMVTHLDATADQVEYAIGKLRSYQF